MKIFFGISMIGICLCLSSISFAHEYSEVICKQKENPISADFVEAGKYTEIKIKYRKKLESFEVINVRGLDGLVVNRFDNLSVEAPEIGQEDTISISIQNNSELQYLVIDFKFKENNKEVISSVTLPVGDISKSQRQERAKNIKKIKSGQEENTNSQQSGKSSGVRQIHKMGLEENN